MRVGIAGLESIAQAKKDLNRFIKTTDSIQEQELNQLVSEALPEMLQKTPYREGTLESGVYCRRSGSKQNKGVVAGAVAMHKGYNYAVIQHENTAYKHPVKGQAHFISEPLQKAVENFIRRVRERVDAAW